MPDYLTTLGRTVGFGANGAVSNLSVFPDAISTMRRELRGGNFDVVHVQEPPAPILGWDASGFGGAPVVGTFHAYAPKFAPQQFAILLGARRKFNQLSGRIAVSEAAEWTGRRWYGGNYEIIPNGVDIGLTPADPPEPETEEELRLLFVGRAEERKGLPVLLRAFEALVEHVPARLVVVGTARDDIARALADPEALRSIDALGAVDRDRLWQELAAADVLCAPSLSGESFGMVLTEAFASGTPVVASEIAGYSDVVSDGVDGVLIPPGDPQRLAEELQRLHVEPRRRAAMGIAARESAERFAWPRIAARVERVYERAIDLPAAGRPADQGAPSASASHRPTACPASPPPGSRRRSRSRSTRAPAAAGSPAASASASAASSGSG